MLDILFIYPPIYFNKEGGPETMDVEHPPLGVLYLASSLEKEHVSAEILDIGAENIDLNRLKNIITEKRPREIGFTTMTANLRGTVQAAEFIKQNFPEIKLILGGAHISADNDFINRFAHLFDVGIAGEAETVLPAIINKMKTNQPVEKFYQGVPVQDLDSLPFPAREKLQHVKYKKGAHIFSSRGCPFKCVFCSRPALSDKMRFRDPMKILDEMEEIYKQGETFFMFADDTLTLKKDHIIGICQEILKRGMKITWTAITRADMLDEDIVKLMKKAGCLEVTLGVESGSERIRNEIIKKNLSTEAIVKAAKLCNKNRVNVNAFLMLGFPTETREDIEKTMQFYKTARYNIVGVHISLPLPGAALFETAKSENKISIDTIDQYARGELGEGFHGSWPFYVPEGFNLQELEDFRKKAYFKFYFRPSYLIRRFFQDISSWENLKYSIKTGLSLLTRGDTSRQ